jgi:hypothetical protein
MALIKGKARQTTAVERVAEGNENYLRLLRDGSVSMADFVATACLEGRVYNVSAGVLTTPLATTAGAMTATTPDCALTVPNGTTVIPLEILFQLEDVGTDVIFEVMATTGAGGSVTTAGTAYYPTNLRVDRPQASACTVSAITITAVAPTSNFSEFWRDGVPKSITKTPNSATVSVLDHPYQWLWTYAKYGYFPVCVGPSHLFTYSSTQAGHGFWKIKWIELPSSAVV